MTFFVNQTSSTRWSTILFSLSGRLRKLQLGRGGRGGGGVLNQFPTRLRMLQTSNDYLPGVLLTPSDVLALRRDAAKTPWMPPSRLQNASQTLQDAEKLSSNRSYLQVRFLLQCLIAELSIAQDSTNTRRIKIIENHWFLQCSKTFLSGPLH